MPLYCNT